MRNFMIGMPQGFDDVKFNRDFLEGFYGIETNCFKDEKEVDKIIKEAEKHNFRIGVHFPLISGRSETRDALFIHPDKDVRQAAYEYIEEDLRLISDKRMKVEYVLFHYPKPVIIPRDFNMGVWRFPVKSEYIYEDEYSIEELKNNTKELFNWLYEKEIQYNFTPVLEFDALNKYICDDDFLEELLIKFYTIKLCLDTGRLHLQHRIDPSFDEIKIIKRFARYAKVVHLWNVRVNENLENSHYPALPNLKEEDGWAPIEKYLKLIREENSEVKIMFEHRSDLISRDELIECYNWIDKIF